MLFYYVSEYMITNYIFYFPYVQIELNWSGNVLGIRNYKHVCQQNYDIGMNKL